MKFREFLSLEIVDTIAEHLVTECLKQDPDWSSEYDEGEIHLCAPDDGGSPMAMTMALYTALNQAMAGQGSFCAIKEGDSTSTVDPATLEAVGFRVRPPVWNKSEEGSAVSWRADTSIGFYSYGKDFDGRYFWQSPAGEIEAVSLEEARTKATRHHAESMLELAGIEFTPKPNEEPTHKPDSHRVERLWRECGLPEYFLGNRGSNHGLYALYAAIVAETENAGILADVSRIKRDYPEDGDWQSCTGCLETEDGHDLGKHPFNEILGCKLGSGCFECGGLGAVWERTLDPMRKPEPPAPWLLPQSIRDAADEARNAHLRWDGNDQIGALSIAIDAAFTAAKAMHLEFAVALSRQNPNLGHLMQRLNHGAMELEHRQGVSAGSTIFGEARAAILELSMRVAEK